MKTTFVLACAVAGVLSALLTPIVRLVAIRFGAVSVPGGRNVNVRAIPRLGGVAITLALFSALGVAVTTSESARASLLTVPRHAVGLTLGSAIMFAVGVVDDLRRMRALHKLAVQVAAAVLAYACGFRIDAIHLPWVGDLSMGVFALPITLMWIIGIVNAINLIDGLDGLAAGVVIFAGVTNLVVASVTDNPFTALLMAAMVGAVLGFLFYNFNPARIFMGDSGSYVLGYVLACGSLIGTAQKASTTLSILVPLLALGLPILDTLFSITRRALERRPIFSPDRGHVHHRLLDMGITHRRAVLILYAVNVALAVAALGVATGRSWQAGVALVSASVVLLGLVRFVGYFEYVHLRGRQRARIRSRHTELLRTLLPVLTRRFDVVSTESEVLALLESLNERGDILSVELVPAQEQAAFVTWQRQGTDAARLAECVSSRFPLGNHALYDLRFRWESEFGDVSPQTEVLLQVIVDLATSALRRAGSVYVPAEVLPAARSSSPAAHASTIP